MCGICGQYNFNGAFVSEDIIRKMMKKMRHRGPDDHGVFIKGPIGLGIVRLSILDLSSAGHQPLHDDSGRYTIAFNGEIYNYIELREELQSKGYTFHSKTDTEVLLKAYINWGESFMHRLNGMFAFVIFDKMTNTLFGARDRFGVKPFYYTITDSYFRFASDIVPLAEVTEKKLNAEYQSIFDFLVFNRTDQSEKTFFREVKKLQHGHCFSIKDGNFNIKQWYNLRSESKIPFINPEEYLEFLSSSISLRLRSDVPVGVCLSGGLDSSSITSLLIKKFNLSNIKTFSAVYNKEYWGDESEYIEEYRHELKNMHSTTPTAETLINDLDIFIQAHSEPVPTTSAYAQYKVMELAKSKVVVTLDGQGADEQLGGYHYFFGVLFKDLFLKNEIQKLCNELYCYWEKHHSFVGIHSFMYYLLPDWAKTFVKVNHHNSLTNDFIKKYKDESRITDHLFSMKDLSEALFDHFEYKLEHLLKWNDRNSMWFSIESRNPFLDYRLVEHSLASPAQTKISNGSTKYILREAMKGIVPEKIRLRKDKIGFSTPDNDWFRTEKFRNFIPDIIESDSFRARGIINKVKAMELYRQHLNGKINISGEIWKWINLELWFRKYID